MRLFSIIITSILLTVSSLWATEAPCPGASIRSLFYQPWKQDLEINGDTWRGYFLQMKAMGIRTLYIQWMQHGNTDFLTARTLQGEIFAAMLFDFAETYDIQVWAGLYHDPDYFSKIKHPPEKLKSYLQRLRNQSLGTAEKIKTQFGHHPAFAGWYLTEEIDDRHWRSSERQTLLTNHLADFTDKLKKLTHGVSVSVSTFFTGQMVPSDYVEMWQTILLHTELTLLVQDGAGAGDLSFYERKLYFEALDNRLGAHYPWGVVIEVFETSKKTKGFSARPAPVARIRKQVQAVSSYSEHTFHVGFSLRYILFDNSSFTDEYINLFCK